MPRTTGLLGEEYLWSSLAEYRQARVLDVIEERLANEERRVELLEQLAALQERKRQTVAKLAGRLTTPDR